MTDNAICIAPHAPEPVQGIDGMQALIEPLLRIPFPKSFDGGLSLTSKLSFAKKALLKLNFQHDRYKDRD
jgi:hypothetical protein